MSSAALKQQKMPTQKIASSKISSHWLSAPPPEVSAEFSGLTGAAFLGGAAGSNQQQDWLGSGSLESSSVPDPKRMQDKHKARVPSLAIVPLGRRPNVGAINSVLSNVSTVQRWPRAQTSKTVANSSKGQWKELAGLALETVHEENMSTVMIRNIACRYTQEECAAFLDEAGFAGKYDFLYLPMNAPQRANLGYVFVNLTHRDYVLELQKAVSGTVFGRSHSIKRCEITLAHIQGAANLARHSHGAGTAFRGPVRRSAPIFADVGATFTL